MAKNDPNDPPPPYYPITVHTLPPLSSYEEVVYGTNPGAAPPNQPRYVPRHPAVVPAVATLPPTRKKRRCCKNNAQCYGGSGGVLLVIALLVLAIWLGIRYGSRLPPLVIFSDDNNDASSSGNQPPSSSDICPNTTVQCDGIRDCTFGTDETNCGKSTNIQAYTETRLMHRLLKSEEREEDDDIP